MPVLSATVARLSRTDIVPALISAADGVERITKLGLRLLRWLVPRSGFGLTGALAWRMAAALAGVGCAAALVTGLSAQDEDRAAASAEARHAASVIVPVPPRAAPAGPTQWTPVVRPIAMFNLAAPELGRAEPAYAARSGSGAREDLLSFGSFAQSAPHLSLAIGTGRLESAGALPFTVAIAREAATMALSTTRSGLPTSIDTRFGPLETADVVLSDGAESRACIAFRSTGSALPFTLRGWWCAGGKPSDRRQLTCLIERLDLVNAAGDHDLRAAFAASELRRNAACDKSYLSSTGRKASWLDADAPAPALRAKTIASQPARAMPAPKERPGKQRSRGASRDAAST